MPLGPLIKLQADPDNQDFLTPLSKIAQIGAQTYAGYEQGQQQEQQQQEQLAQEIRTMMQADPSLTFEQARNLVLSGITAKDVFKQRQDVASKKEVAKYKKDISEKDYKEFTDQELIDVGLRTKLSREAFRKISKEKQMQSYMQLQKERANPTFTKAMVRAGQSLFDSLFTPYDESANQQQPQGAMGPQQDQMMAGQQQMSIGGQQVGQPQAAMQQQDPVQAINQQLVNQVPGQQQGLMDQIASGASKIGQSALENPLSRNVIGAAARFGEGYGGFPLAIAQKMGDLAPGGMSEEQINRLPFLSDEQKEELRKSSKDIMARQQEEGRPGNLIDMVKEATKPRNPAEDIVGKMAQGVGAMMSGGGTTAGKALKAVGLGKLAGFGAKKAGAGPLIESAVEFMTTLGVGAGLDKKVKDSVSKYYNRTKNVGQNVPLDSRKIYEVGKRAIKRAESEGKGTSKYEAVNKAWEALKEKLVGKEALEAAARKENTPFREQIIKEGLKDTKTNAASMQDFVTGFKSRVADVKNNKEAKDALIAFKSKLTRALEDPNLTSKKYADMYKQANKAWRGIKDAENVNEWLWDKLPTTFRNYLSQRGMLRNLTRTVGGAAMTPISKVYNTFNLLNNSPLARKAYAKMVRAAVQENPAVATKAAKELMKTLKAEEKKL